MPKLRTQHVLLTRIACARAQDPCPEFAVEHHEQSMNVMPRRPQQLLGLNLDEVQFALQPCSTFMGGRAEGPQTQRDPTARLGHEQRIAMLHCRTGSTAQADPPPGETARAIADRVECEDGLK